MKGLIPGDERQGLEKAKEEARKKLRPNPVLHLEI